MNLDELRAALTELDGELLALVAKRQALSEQVAAVKRATGRATRDFAREREVILRGRKPPSASVSSPRLPRRCCGNSSNRRWLRRSKRALQLRGKERANGRW